MPIKHRAGPGDSIPSIAFQYGFFPGTVWNHPDNAALKATRKSPNILFEGDEVAVPDLRPRSVDCETGKKHVFRRRGVPSYVRLRLLKDGEPRAHVAYRLEAGGKTVTGYTDEDGRLCEPVLPDVQTALLTVEGHTLQVAVGRLNPITERSGVCTRLQNLGFECDLSEEGLRAGVVAFQKRHGLAPTGECSGETASKLLEVHGC